MIGVHATPSHSFTIVVEGCDPPICDSTTVRPRELSNAICRQGTYELERSNQSTPFHSHVPAGVTSTATPRHESNVISPPDVGTVAGKRCVHAVPSHSQVSLNVAGPSRPPNSTVTARRLSNAIACCERGAGPLTGRQS